MAKENWSASRRNLFVSCMRMASVMSAGMRHISFMRDCVSAPRVKT